MEAGKENRYLFVSNDRLFLFCILFDVGYLFMFKTGMVLVLGLIFSRLKLKC
jgi:hypothetical protein